MKNMVCAFEIQVLVWSHLLVVTAQRDLQYKIQNIFQIAEWKFYGIPN